MWSLADASPDRLYDLAQALESSGRWTSYLTPQEHQLFLVALRHNRETWRLFLKGRIPCQLRVSENDGRNFVTTEMDPVTLAFRIRYMLWQSQLDANGEFVPAQTDTTEDNTTTNTTTTSGTQSLRNEAESNSDDDYDDDDDEDDKPNGTGGDNDDSTPLAVLVADSKPEDSEPDARGRNAAIMNSSQMYDLFDQDLEKMKRFQRLKASDEQIRGDNEDEPPLSAEFTNNYQAEEDAVAHGNSGGTTGSGGVTSSFAAFAKTAQFGSANLCLKHLLTRIETKRSEMQVTDIELRNLISDVRKNRSKWANEERIGQEELYEACERVVQELRGTTEHSTAFLNKVSKREAPNYYDIIKHPMDLNTVMRKLRALQYNSKKEFVDDLNLIWTNCFTYNSDPAHFLRVHAAAMRKKTEALAPLIPDVTIRSRAEVEAEAERMEREARENLKRRDSESETGKGSKRKKGMAPSKGQTEEGEEPQEQRKEQSEQPEQKGSKGTTRSIAEPENPTPEPTPVPTPAAAETRSGTPAAANANATASAAASATASAAASVEASRHESEEAEGEVPGAISQIEDDEYRVPDAETAFWNSATRRKRIQCILGRQGIFSPDNKLQMDAPIVARTPGAMLRFERTLKGEDIFGQTAGISLLSTDPGKEPFMIEYETNAGVPQTPPSDNSAWITAPIPKLQELAPSRYLSHGVMNDLVLRNLNEMQIIRRLCSKILYIKDLQSGQLPLQHDPATSAGAGAGAGAGASAGGASVGTQAEYPKIFEPEEDISSRLPGALEMDGRASYSSMKRTVAKIAMQAGFESAQPRAVDTLTSIAGEYLMKLGETLVAQLEAPDSTASFTTIVNSSLEVMGIQRLSQLSKYMGDNVFRQGRRLATFRNRLNTMLTDILRPEVERYQDEQFQDNSEQFVLGQFSNELGDDYFGFKDLGINEDLGVTNIAVPFHLLQQRVAYQDSGIAQHGIRPSKLGLDVPEYPPLTRVEILEMPALFKSAFEKLIPAKLSAGTGGGGGGGGGDNNSTDNDSNNNAAIDSFFASQASQASHARAKVPSSGKLVPRKKRFDRAYIVVKPEPPKIEEEYEEEDQDEDQEDNSSTPATGATQPSTDATSPAPPDSDAADDGSMAPEDDHMSDVDADMELNNEIGSLAFENESAAAAATSNGFSFDDSLPTGSLMLQGDDEEDAPDNNEDLGFDFNK